MSVLATTFQQAGGKAKEKEIITKFKEDIRKSADLKLSQTSANLFLRANFKASTFELGGFQFPGWFISKSVANLNTQYVKIF